MNLTDIYWQLLPTTAKYTFFLSAQRIFLIFKIDHTIGNKISLNTFLSWDYAEYLCWQKYSKARNQQQNTLELYKYTKVNASLSINRARKNQ